MGRFEEGIRESRNARRLDPLSPGVLHEAGTVFRSARQYDSAIAMLVSARANEPFFEGVLLPLAQAYLAKEMWSESRALLDTMLQAGVERRRVLGLLGYIHAQQGRRDSALLMLRQLDVMGQRENVWDAVAMIHMGLGDHERALDALELAAVRRQSGLLVLLNVSPVMDPLRSHPRFARIREKLKLPLLPVQSPPEQRD
jgi:tetratricopeptide (TPR) repeat protein